LPLFLSALSSLLLPWGLVPTVKGGDTLTTYEVHSTSGLGIISCHYQAQLHLITA